MYALLHLRAPRRVRLQGQQLLLSDTRLSCSGVLEHQRRRLRRPGFDTQHSVQRRFFLLGTLHKQLCIRLRELQRSGRHL